MPELPEVETTRRGIAPHVVDRRVTALSVREPRLRWPVPARLSRELPGQRLISVERRAKFLLLHAEHGTVIIHLGMSGSLRVADARAPLRKHDRVEIRLEDGAALRLHDPRRFGAVLWTRRDPLRHRLLRKLGPEPLAPGFDGAHLHALAAGRRVAVKCFLMNGHVVAGVGNIYASEALFLAGIHPARAAGRVARSRYDALADAVREVLAAAIDAGGTTLRDFVGADGEPGYFRVRLHVYGRAGDGCERCGGPIHQRVLGQRSSYYCPRCQH